jgi:hypothetical protein
MLFSSHNCTVTVGDLFISNLPVEINEDVLFNALKTLQSIRGVLNVNNNPYLTSLSCMSNISSLYGASYLNNPNLVDARMPKLVDLRGPVTVVGCDRLCPARYTAVGVFVNGSDAGCTNLKRQAFFHFEGPGANAAAVAIAANVMGNALRYFSGNTVRFKSLSFLYHLLYDSSIKVFLYNNVS